MFGSGLLLSEQLLDPKPLNGLVLQSSPFCQQILVLVKILAEPVYSPFLFGPGMSYLPFDVALFTCGTKRVLVFEMFNSPTERGKKQLGRAKYSELYEMCRIVSLLLILFAVFCETGF